MTTLEDEFDAQAAPHRTVDLPACARRPKTLQVGVVLQAAVGNQLHSDRKAVSPFGRICG